MYLTLVVNHCDNIDELFDWCRAQKVVLRHVYDRDFICNLPKSVAALHLRYFHRVAVLIEKNHPALIHFKLRWC
jgi:hypothetical protein